jgi:hypothetical protein
MSTNLQDAVNNARLCHKNEMKIYKDCEAALEEASRRLAGPVEFELLKRRWREQNRIVFDSYARLLDAMAEDSEKRITTKETETNANVDESRACPDGSRQRTA